MRKSGMVDEKKSTIKIFLSFLNASDFFPKYAPGVENWKHKLRGYSGKKKPMDFTQNDIVEITKGVKKYHYDLFLFSVENEK